MSLQPQPSQGYEPQMNTDETQMLHDGATPEYPLKDLTEKVIGAAFEVHNQLRSGFLEKVYENALLIELHSRGIEAVGQVLVPVSYKGAAVGDYVADLLIARSLLCEIKAIKDLSTEHRRRSSTI